jgi:hypothetical protein
VLFEFFDGIHDALFCLSWRVPEPVLAGGRILSTGSADEGNMSIPSMRVPAG